ncbi:hypothetical protein [Oryza sativa Japonica Group]|uniref:Uncharacterized protein n=1 Tax=Oryza sativa subsp. japonica TaxID=39947 RepID=Q5N8G5_ORYSJ|nr:hypothetical protein [Oryza sativa Japonica Group]BAD82241.1 hypothetical protein [Oryza sativa Japonica Group]
MPPRVRADAVHARDAAVQQMFESPPEKFTACGSGWTRGAAAAIGAQRNQTGGGGSTAVARGSGRTRGTTALGGGSRHCASSLHGSGGGGGVCGRRACRASYFARLGMP